MFGPADLREHANAGVLVVYFGLVLLIGAWWLLGRRLEVDQGWLLRTMALWAAPLVLGPPLFSRDVYSYLAQGAMVVADLDVYRFGPAQLGGPLADEVPLIWQHTPAPYGPVFLRLAAGVASLAEADVVAGVLGMRLVALIGLALMTFFLPMLAKAGGVDPIAALWLGALNPLVLLHLVAGAHNDAFMLGLLVAGLALAATNRPLAGAVLVSLAGLVKAPAALGLLAVAWLWAGQARQGYASDQGNGKVAQAPFVLHRLAQHKAGAVLATGFVALATGIIVTIAAGTGYGWMSALDTPISATNWSVSSVLGRLSGNVPLWRWIGLGAAALAGVVVWLRRPTLSPVYALGLTLAALAMLGPATRPWYLLWGLIPIAAAAPAGAARRWLAILSVALAVVVLPDGYPPTVNQLALAALGGVLAALALVQVGARWKLT